MEKHFLLFLILALNLCNGHGHLGKLSGLLIGATQEVHNKVHDVAGTVLGGFNFNVHGHVGHHQRPVQQPSRGGETIVVIVEETSSGDQGQGQTQRPYGTPQQGQQPPNGYNPNQGHTPNNGYNPNQGYNPPRPNPPVNYGQRPQYGQNNGNTYGQQQNMPSYPSQPGHNHQNGQGYNQNTQENNVYNGNVNPNQKGYGNPNNNVNNPNPNGNVVINPEQNQPNSNNNYKPAETYNTQQHNDGHQAETHKETNDKTTKKPLDDGPLFVPLNDYTYGDDKIAINAPKRDTDKATTEKVEEDFPIDIRFKDE